ncbi:3',5'-cyclic-nucleotide phosphodiesterase regA [Nannizzia gypsea CBS 118893]|uniref:Phosphodiesterase n=1 Tax=Arthroderma gypseum (strain ATCC MYA-4604 / CBS 118893) TaxID=535722 RepID=E4V020_ARTGP|nr:3',5'-cyclic-nucleotide phosphodiesterase regA [Nannizzia gypsea CBS 118893]EFR02957.1 3',5'-cyclic-nucleotide phosphodiesterase regA [Nannizzia gypsea CBS 118893]
MDAAAAACWAVYLDDRVDQERWIERDGEQLPESAELAANLARILAICRQVYVCNSGKSFATKVAELTDAGREEGDSDAAIVPVLAFIDIAVSGDAESSHIRRHGHGQASAVSPSTSTSRRSLAFSSESEELFGLHLLSRFSADIQARETPHAIIPIAILRNVQPQPSPFSSALLLRSGKHVEAAPKPSSRRPDDRQISRCLDAGAIDVLVSPIDQSRVHGLLTHAYRIRRAAQKENSRFMANSGQKMRKYSWVGVSSTAEDERPYAYLREAMVSKLMKRICNPEEALDDSLISDVCVSDERKEEVKAAIAEWHFCAHDFTDDELCYASCLMFEHTLTMPALEHWRISSESLREFVLSCRAAYNSFILYHNFRHAVDVLQSTFHILVRVGVIPPFPLGSERRSSGTGMSCLLTPFDALALLVIALGHDVGHPGVNNMFLVKLNAPLAQLYNDRSVLEAFHCAAYSQILRRHWPSVFQDTEMRTLMISSILATDMGIHNHFIDELGKLRGRYEADARKVDSWIEKDVRDYRVLLCALIIKCADISNVARPFKVAEQWTDVLQLEFANQGEMEVNIGIATSLFGGPPELGNFIKKAKGQVGFMDIFGLPLFDGVTDILPDLAFAANTIRSNRFIWAKLMEHEEEVAAHRARNCDTPRCQGADPSWEEYRRRLIEEGPASMGYTIQHRSPPQSPIRSPPQLDGEADTNSSIQVPSSATAGPATNVSVIVNGIHHNHHNQHQHQHAHANRQSQRSAGRSSVQNTARTIDSGSGCSGSGGGVRTQSTSTYTNNTLITPLSSTTQASSVISVGSSVEEKDSTCQLHQRLNLKPSSMNHARRRDLQHQAKPDDVAAACGASTTTASSYTSSLAQNENEDEHDHDGVHQNTFADENLPCPVNALPCTTDGASSYHHPPQTWYERATNSKAGERRSKFISGLFEKAGSNNSSNINAANTNINTNGNHPAGLTLSKSAQSTPTVHNNSHHHHGQHTRGRRGGPTIMIPFPPCHLTMQRYHHFLDAAPVYG